MYYAIQHSLLFLLEANDVTKSSNMSSYALEKAFSDFKKDNVTGGVLGKKIGGSADRSCTVVEDNYTERLNESGDSLLIALKIMGMSSDQSSSEKEGQSCMASILEDVNNILEVP